MTWSLPAGRNRFLKILLTLRQIYQNRTVTMSSLSSLTMPQTHHHHQRWFNSLTVCLLFLLRLLKFLQKWHQVLPGWLRIKHLHRYLSLDSFLSIFWFFALWQPLSWLPSTSSLSSPFVSTISQLWLSLSSLSSPLVFSSFLPSTSIIQLFFSP